jgi:hypothetical protein
MTIILVVYQNKKVSKAKKKNLWIANVLESLW